MNKSTKRVFSILVCVSVACAYLSYRVGRVHGYTSAYSQMAGATKQAGGVVKEAIKAMGNKR